MDQLTSRLALLEASVLQVMSHTEDILDVTKHRSQDTTQSVIGLNAKVQDIEEKLQKGNDILIARIQGISSQVDRDMRDLKEEARGLARELERS